MKFWNRIFKHTSGEFGFKTVLILTLLHFFSFIHIASGGSESGEIPRVAVLNLEISGGIAEAYASTLTDRLREELIATGEFKVMERNKMTEILDEIGFQYTGCTSNECVIQAGRILGVNEMVAGSVGRIGELHTVSLRLIDVETSEIVKMESVDRVGSIEEVLTTQIRQAAQKLAAKSTSDDFFQQEFMGRGNVRLTSVPSGARVYIDGEETDFNTPADLTQLTAGKHNIRLEKGELIGSKGIFVLPDITSEVNIELNRGYGSIQVSTEPSGGEVFINGKSVGQAPVKLDTVSCGFLNLTVKKEGYNDYTEEMKIGVNDLKKCAVKLDKLSEVTIKSQPEDAKVFLDGRLAGKAPIHLEKLKSEEHSISLKYKGYKSTKAKFVIAPGEQKILEYDLIPKNRSTGILLSAIIPGSGQIYGDHPRGYLILACQIGAGFAAYYYVDKHKTKVEEYEAARAEYLSAVYVFDIEAARAKMEAAYSETEDMKKVRDMALMAAGAVYLINLIDIIFIADFPEKPSGVNLHSKIEGDDESIKFGLTYSF